MKLETSDLRHLSYRADLEEIDGVPKMLRRPEGRVKETWKKSQEILIQRAAKDLRESAKLRISTTILTTPLIKDAISAKKATKGLGGAADGLGVAIKAAGIFSIPGAMAAYYVYTAGRGLYKACKKIASNSYTKEAVKEKKEAEELTTRKVASLTDQEKIQAYKTYLAELSSKHKGLELRRLGLLTTAQKIGYDLAHHVNEADTFANKGGRSAGVVSALGPLAAGFDGSKLNGDPEALDKVSKSLELFNAQLRAAKTALAENVQRLSEESEGDTIKLLIEEIESLSSSLNTQIKKASDKSDKVKSLAAKYREVQS